MERSPTPATQQSTLEFLMRRMEVKGDFPAMSASINAIQRLAASEQSSFDTLSNSILKDFALTNKILRLVNSAYYAKHSGERVRTVSRAIVLMGFDAVRSIAISLMLFDHIRDKEHADVLKEEFLRISLSGILARELCTKFTPGQAEEAFICALFHHLGRLLSYYYFWEEAESIRGLMATEKLSEHAAALRVLGISYPDLGMGVARSWGFPSSITQSMRSLGEGPVPRAAGADAQLHQVSVLANEICAALESTSGPERSAALGQIAERFRNSLTLPAGELDQTIQRAVSRLGELTEALQINLRKTGLGSRICEPDSPAPAAMSTDTQSAVPGSAELVETNATENGGSDAILTAGIQDISRALVEDMPPNDVLRIVAETVYRGLGVRRVLICTRDRRDNRMTARFGFGANVDQLVRHFAFPLGGNDLFNAILSQDTGVLIRDGSEPKVRSRLPGWYLEHFDAPAFIVFPMNIRKVPVAMIYADHERPGGILATEKQLALLHTLRNQALLAVKLSA